MKIKDAEIISLMQNPRTQDKGVRALMDAYQSRLYWHIRRIIVDGDLAQDTLQETFIKAYQNFHQFKNDSQLYTWLYRIATNEALQQVNKMKKMQKTDEDPNIICRILLPTIQKEMLKKYRFYCRTPYKACPKSRNWYL
jgi:RNA polymerase sigma-70 factor (ECF subfamily)